MGWDYCHNTTRQKLIDSAIVPFVGDTGAKVNTIAYADHGGVLWTLRHVDYGNGKTRRGIMCSLIEGGGRSWGQKDMDETMGPYFYDCPLYLLELAGEPWPGQPHRAELANNWRKLVVEWHEEQKIDPKEDLRRVVLVA